jgi:PhzF family phenazine biosynthesis protein
MVIVYQIDSFAEQPFAGNPAAVCLLDGTRKARWMQAMATEMNLSETAFVRRLGSDFELRWFTPTMEVELCGHGTLAAAHALWREGTVELDQQIRFQTCSGVLTAVRNVAEIQLDFPATPPEECAISEEILAALSISPTYIGRSRFDKLLLVADEETVRGLRPDFSRLAGLGARGVIVTSPSGDRRFDFVSRYFAPGAGIDEDPVTGSAHCCLAPFWAERLGRNELTGYQASARGGIVRTIVQGDRVLLGGRAVTIFRGELSANAAGDELE